MYLPKKKVRISVIVPTLNEEKLVGQTLRNVRNVAPEAELIVVDGGSKDRTVEIARKYAKVLYSHTNIAAARNIGANAADGEILVFLDADTNINRKFIDEAINELMDPKVVGAGGLIMPQRAGTFLEAIFYFFNFIIMAAFFFGKPILAGTCVAYKKSAFFGVGGFDEKMAASEDFDLCNRISNEGKMVFLRKVIVRTSRRRLDKLGLSGLISDWSRVTVQYLLGKKPKSYRVFR